MTPLLPPGVSPAAMAAALRAFVGIVGAGNVFTTDDDRETYNDVFAFDDDLHMPAAGVAASSVDEVRAIVRAANHHGVPLWPISRGKNFGYGGSAPRLRGSVVLDLSRMKKIEVDAANGTVLVEPGVNFYDLYEFIQRNDLPYWISVPGNSWGSVAGNALDRGFGYTSFGDHTARICGIEAVLPDGDLVRTGMGAMEKPTGWQLYRYGFGPAWDQMFVQSNLGVVTKLGLWLLPAPESMIGLDVELDQPEDLGWIIDALAPFRRDGTLQQAPSVGNWLRPASALTTRSDWTDTPGPLAESAITAIRKKFGIGWWSVNLRLFGHASVNEAALALIKARITAAGKPMAIKETRWTRGDAPERSAFAGYPVTFPLQNVGWYGGRGGHIAFSPVMPMQGDAALAQFKRCHARYQAAGLDYQGSFSLGERHMTNVSTILFDRDDTDMTGRIRTMFDLLVADATAQGYGEYRTHLDYMDLVADTYAFNDGALRRLNERVKDALDPKGIIAPGKSGIWPARFREGRGK